MHPVSTVQRTCPLRQQSIRLAPCSPAIRWRAHPRAYPRCSVRAAAVTIDVGSPEEYNAFLQAHVDELLAVGALPEGLDYEAARSFIMMEHEMSTGMGPLLVARDDGETQPVGYVKLGRHDDEYRKGWAIVANLSVREGWRGKGVGTALMEAAEKQARDWGCTSLELQHDISEEHLTAWYQRIGFVPVSKKEQVDRILSINEDDIASGAVSASEILEATEAILNTCVFLTKPLQGAQD